MIETDFIPYAASAALGSGSVLVLAPHPDDEVFGCGGAIIQHVTAGDPVRVVIVTDGAWMEQADYAATRRAESRAAANVLGYGAPEFWNLPDRSLQYGERLIARIQQRIDETAADLVYAPSSREIHPDHRALALAAAEAVRRCSRPIGLVMYEVGVPLQPNRLLDITTLYERKLAAVACFASQLERQPYDRHITSLNRFRTYTLPPAVEAAEAYRIVSRDELRRDPIGVLRQEPTAGPGWSAEASLSLPLVSVIVRSRDRPNLRATLDAVALQTYPHVEIVVVNALGPAHGALPEWWGRFPLRLVTAEPPLSWARASNAGLDHSRGDFLLLMDDDDGLPPDHIAALASRLGAAAPSQCACGVVDSEPAPEDAAAVGTRTTAFPRAKLRSGRVLPLPSVLFKRTLLAEGCRFDETLPQLEDWDFLLQVAQRTEFVCPGGRSGAAATSAPMGDRIPVAPASEAATRIYDKWRTIWSGADWAEILHGCQRSLEQHIHAARRRQDEDARRLAEYRDALNQCRAQVTDQAALIDRQRERLGELEQTLRRLQQDHASLQDWSSGLQRTVQELHQSTSWHLTRPLRFLARLWRREVWSGCRRG